MCDFIAYYLLKTWLFLTARSPKFSLVSPSEEAILSSSTIRIFFSLMPALGGSSSLSPGLLLFLLHTLSLDWSHRCSCLQLRFVLWRLPNLTSAQMFWAPDLYIQLPVWYHLLVLRGYLILSVSQTGWRSPPLSPRPLILSQQMSPSSIQLYKPENMKLSPYP